MHRVWYWAIVDRESDGRFLASIPDLGDLAAYGDTEKDAVAHVAELAASMSGHWWRAASRLPAHATRLKCRAPFDPRKSAGP
jgi:hypothetical protein